MVLSLFPLTSIFPSGAKPTVGNSPSIAHYYTPCKSNTLMELSSPALTILLLSGEKATDHILFVCLFIVDIS